MEDPYTTGSTSDRSACQKEVGCNRRDDFMAEKTCCVGQRMLHYSREALQPEGHMLSLRGCQCYSMFEASLEIMDNTFLLSKILESKMMAFYITLHPDG